MAARPEPRGEEKSHIRSSKLCFSLLKCQCPLITKSLPQLMKAKWWTPPHSLHALKELSRGEFSYKSNRQLVVQGEESHPLHPRQGSFHWMGVRWDIFILRLHWKEEDCKVWTSSHLVCDAFYYLQLSPMTPRKHTACVCLEGMGSVFWIIRFVPQHSMHRVKHSKLSFVLHLRFQSHLGPGKILFLNYQTFFFFSMLWETLQRKKLSYPEVLEILGDRGSCTYIHSSTYDACGLKCACYTFLDSLLHRRKRCLTDTIRIRILEI